VKRTNLFTGDKPMTASSLPKKLLMKAGQRAIILNAPAGYLDQLAPLPEGVEIAASPEGQFDFVQLFTKDMADLQKFLPLAKQAVKYDALLWVAYPKGSAKTGMDLNRDLLWAAASEHHLTGVTLISLDEIWSAMRFRPSERVGK
jgi:hypothetical protein